MAGRVLAVVVGLAGGMAFLSFPSGAAADAAGVRQAAPVSPGDWSEESEISTPCPTYSWSPAADDEASEIAVFELREESGKVEPSLVFSRRFAPGATSWTPARAECLAAGGRYAWVVRSAASAGAAVGDWSEARRFFVSPGPSDDEVAAALDVLRRHYEAFETGRSTAGAGTESFASEISTRRKSASSRLTPEGVGGSAAIRGELAAASGETYGVLGVSNSAAGAGLAARNSANGADLRLDGSAAGATDLALSEAGLDRSSAGTETFNVQNSGSGSIVLQVEGEAVLTTSALQWSGIANIPAGFADGVDDDTQYAAGNQLQLNSGTFDILEGSGSGLDADTLDSLDSTDFVTTSSLGWASVRRKFYLTVGTFTGSQPLSAPACSAGYHMASLWEILDVSNLAYLQAPGVAQTRTDAGYGPPVLLSGWIRSGYDSYAAPLTGFANCSVWTVDAGSGTAISLGIAQGWQDYTNDDGLFEGVRRLSPWQPALASCADPLPVWCVED